MNRWITIIFIVIFSLIGFSYYKRIFVNSAEMKKINSNNISENSENIAEDNQTVDENNKNFEQSKNKCEYKKYTISDGDIPADMFSEQAKFDANDVVALLSASEEIYDFTKLRIDREIRFCFEDGEKASYFEYDRNIDDMIVVAREGDNFTVEQKPIEYEVEEVFVEGKIENFLYVDAIEKGMSEATIVTMADVFSFDIDFTTEIQKGDEFKVIYEKRRRFGEDGPDGNILAAKFVNQGETYYAYYFKDGEERGYYDSEGKMLQRQFLRAPLSYKYISSGYTGARFHPITKKVSAHYQIDYAAATGTPVVSTAKGKVTQASYTGGWGNMVKIEHANGYSTHYAHLSKYGKGVKVGATVTQGQIIGYVGNTGWSTGPHLDYGMRLNGKPMNPLSLKLPKGDGISEGNLGGFEEVKRGFEEKLK
ncbi:MAG: peptidoglycan DD-metalloendopeptidase family protein [Candidatus Moranbacteria bacterium]|nr:peptidoglycan DD-metalloendopeptidase family protein [Candidatus Moranbacteria bacterium]